MKRQLTQSEAKSFRNCKREWYLSTYLRLRLKPEHQRVKAAYLGSLIHGALEYNETGDWKTWLADSRESQEELFADQPSKLKLSIDAHNTAEIMIEGYMQWLERTGADQFFSVEGVERKISADFEGWTLMGLLDKLVRHTEFDTYHFIDYKKTSDLTSIPQWAPYDEQFLHYTLLLRLAYDGKYAVKSGIWRQLVSSKRTDRTLAPDGSEREFYGEHEYEFSDTQIESYAVRLRGIMADIERVEAALDAGEDHRLIVYPTPRRDYCLKYCQFSVMCPMFDDGSRVDDFINDYYEKGDPLDRYADKDEIE